MSGELIWLAMSAGLSFVIWIPYTILYAGISGIKAGTTEVPPTSKLPAWAQRSHRAHMNLLESLVPFAILVLIVNQTENSDSSTDLAAQIFFFARLTHVIVYTLGIPFLRTVAFVVGWAACLYLFWQLTV